MRSDYFSANDGKNARSVLEASRIFAGAQDAIAMAIDKGVYIDCKSGEKLIEQDFRDKDVYIVLEGEFDILVNGRGVSRRGATDVSGVLKIYILQRFEIDNLLS